MNTKKPYEVWLLQEIPFYRAYTRQGFNQLAIDLGFTSAYQMEIQLSFDFAEVEGLFFTILASRIVLIKT